MLKTETSIKQITQYISYQKEYKGVNTYHKLMSQFNVNSKNNAKSGEVGWEENYSVNSRKPTKVIWGLAGVGKGKVINTIAFQSTEIQKDIE